jgi:Spherulation-specific family 4
MNNKWLTVLGLSGALIVGAQQAGGARVVTEGGMEAASSQAAPERTVRVAVPAYIFSDDLRGWEAIIDSAPVIPIAVLNPRNGPNVYAGTRCEGYTPPPDPGTGPVLTGLRFDDDFVSVRFPNDPRLVPSSTGYLATLEQHFIRRSEALRAAGITTYGYVWSNTNGADPSCRRTAAIVREEIDQFRISYGIANVFLDDASNACPNDDRRAMAEIARSRGARVVLNAGSISGPCLATEADVVVNFEGTPSSYLAASSGLAANAIVLRGANTNVKLWHIVHGATDANVDAIIAQANLSADYLFITDDTTQAHGCDRGNSNFDALYGMWPLIRHDVPSCSGRSNGSTRTWASVVQAIAGPTSVPVTSTTVFVARDISTGTVMPSPIGAVPRPAKPRAPTPTTSW